MPDSFVSFRWTGAARRNILRYLNATVSDAKNHGVDPVFEDPDRFPAVRDAAAALATEKDTVYVPTKEAAEEILSRVNSALQAPPIWADPADAGPGPWGRKDRARAAAAVRSLRVAARKLRNALEDGDA